jgi:prepilin-type N-terminal cleavage/methylation domain-containing protein/prepilin-type processing-associated H-X9-DG protein
VRERVFRGFTLIELLVVIAIIAVLIALLLPAVQAAREAARRSQCVNNFKQVGLAMHNYHDTQGSLPIGRMGIGYTYGNNVDQRRTWAFSILPFFEQTQAFNALNFNWAFYAPPNTTIILIAQRVFQCPSDTPTIQEPDTPYPRGKGNVAANWGNTHFYQDESGRGNGVYPSDAGGNPFKGPVGTVTFGLAPFQGNISNNFRSFTDGTSNTVLVSEVIMGFNAGGNLYDHRGDLFNDDYNCTMFMGYTAPNSKTPDALGGDANGRPWCTYGLRPNVPPCTGGTPAFNASRSRHSGGVNSLFGDGSVRWVKDSVNINVWRALTTMGGNETISSDAY